METESARLQSFFQRGRLWPHAIQNWTANPATLSKSGFYFNPITSERSSDNVTCYLCVTSINGWTQHDQPTEKHLQHSPDCPLHHLKQSVEARLKSFGRWWPHNETFLATPQRLAECGFHYNPADDSKDMVQCSQCDLALDGWEPTDDPMEEHLNRAPKCGFFKTNSLSKQTTKKTTGSKRRGRSTAEHDSAANSDESFVSTISTATSAAGRKRRKPATRDSDVSMMSVASTATRSNRRWKAQSPVNSSRETIAASDLSFTSIVSTATTRFTRRTRATAVDQSLVSEVSIAPASGRGRKKKVEPTAQPEPTIDQITVNDSVLTVETTATMDKVNTETTVNPSAANRGRRKKAAEAKEEAPPAERDETVAMPVDQAQDSAGAQEPTSMEIDIKKNDGVTPAVEKVPAKQRGRPRKNAKLASDAAEASAQPTATSTRGRRKKIAQTPEKVSAAPAVVIQPVVDSDNIPKNHDIVLSIAGLAKVPAAKRTYKRTRKAAAATAAAVEDSAEIPASEVDDLYDPKSIQVEKKAAKTVGKSAAGPKKKPNSTAISAKRRQGRNDDDDEKEGNDDDGSFEELPANAEVSDSDHSEKESLVEVPARRTRPPRQRKKVNYFESADTTKISLAPVDWQRQQKAYDISGPILAINDAEPADICESAVVDPPLPTPPPVHVSVEAKKLGRASSAAFSLSLLPEDINNQSRLSFCDAQEDILNLSSIMEEVPVKTAVSNTDLFSSNVKTGISGQNSADDDILIIDIVPDESAAVAKPYTALDLPAPQSIQIETVDSTQPAASVAGQENKRPANQMPSIRPPPVEVVEKPPASAAGKPLETADFNLDGIQIEQSDLDGTVEQMLRKMMAREMRRLETENEELMLEFIREYDRKVEYLKSQIEVLPQ